MTTTGPISDAELENRFSHHPPTAERILIHERIRREGLRFAKILRDCTPAGDEQKRMIDAIDDAVKHANAAVARQTS